MKTNGTRVMPSDVFRPELLPLVRHCIELITKDGEQKYPRTDLVVLEKVITAITPEEIENLKSQKSLEMIMAIASGMFLAALQQTLNRFTNEELEDMRN